MRCDCHVHIVGPPERYPQLPERSYTAGVAALDTLRRNGAARGIARFVIVQPSFYGTDNCATLDALDTLGGNGRGVAVIDPKTTSPETLAAYHRRGVRGLRVNLYSPIKAPAGDRLDAAFAATAAVAQAMSWHVQAIAPLGTLLQNSEVLARAPVPLVVDHYGLYGHAGPDDADGRRLLDLVRMPHVWVKLSAPYRLADGPLSTRPDRAWLAAMLAAASARWVWGSDWPHPPPHEQQAGAEVVVPYREISYQRLVDDFIAALPSADFAEPIMTENPARLYGF
ncbi:MAG: amidohydrolase family protein [Xanthobacteraceae bacterium]